MLHYNLSEVKWSMYKKYLIFICLPRTEAVFGRSRTCSRAGQGQWWYLRWLHWAFGLVEHPCITPWESRGREWGHPEALSMFDCLHKACQFQDGLVRMNGWLKKAVSQRRQRWAVHTARQRSNARLYSQVISAVTGLIQGLWDISHFSNRTIFVGPKKELRMEMWPAGHGCE